MALLIETLNSKEASLQELTHPLEDLNEYTGLVFRQKL